MPSETLKEKPWETRQPPQEKIPEGEEPELTPEVFEPESEEPGPKAPDLTQAQIQDELGELRRQVPTAAEFSGQVPDSSLLAAEITAASKIPGREFANSQQAAEVEAKLTKIFENKK